MSAVRRAYSSTVPSPLLLAGGAGVAVALCWWLLVVQPASPIGPVAGVVVLAADVYSATVRLSIGGGRIYLGQGPFRRPVRVIPLEAVAATRSELLSWPQVFGLGVPWRGRTTRMTVRPGPTLVVELHDGEVIRISTPDPDAAVALLSGPDPVASSPVQTSSRQEHR